MKTSHPFTEALALVVQYLRAERMEYESQARDPRSSIDDVPPRQIWAAAEVLGPDPIIYDVCKATWD